LSPYEIRVGTAIDIDSVLRLWPAAGSEPTVSDTDEALALLLDVDPAALLVAEHDAAVVGSLIVGWDGWRGSFYRLAVRPDHRRRGIASALIREGEWRLRQRGAMRLTAIVVDGAPAAAEFWRAVGFDRQSRRARYVRNV